MPLKYGGLNSSRIQLQQPDFQDSGKDPFDFLNQNRLRRIFLQDQQLPTIQDTASVTAKMPSNPAGGYNPLDEPLTKENRPYMDQYAKYLESLPDENDPKYRPKWYDRVAAGVIGASTMDPVKAYQTTRGLLDEPYNSDMAKYKQKAGNLKDLAELEDKRLGVDRERAKDKFNAQITMAQELRQSGYTDAQIKNINDEIRNRNLTKVTGTDGHTYLVDSEGKKTDLGQFAESLSDTRKYNEGESDRVAARNQKNAKELLGTRSADALALQNARDAAYLTRAERLARLKAELAGGGDGSGGMTPPAQEAALDLAMKQEVLDNPKKYGPILGANGKVNTQLMDVDLFEDFMAGVRGRLNVIRSRAPKGGGELPPGNLPINPNDKPNAPPVNANPDPIPPKMDTTNDAANKGVLQGKPRGKYTMGDNSHWQVDANGNPTRID